MAKKTQEKKDQVQEKNLEKVQVDNTGSIFQKSCLIQLATSCWLGSRNIPPAVLEKVGKSDWVRGKKLLINPEYLGPVHTTIHRARNYLKSHALPFPVNGLTLVPKESIAHIEAALREFEDQYWQKVDVFLESYESARNEAKETLGELFSEADYPINIKQKFRFDWRFLLLDVPSQTTLLSPEIYEREKAKFQNLMEETRDLAMVALREEFSAVITELADKLSGGKDGKPRMIRSSMLKKVNQFLGSFQSRNIFADDKLAELINQAKTLVNDVSPYALKHNDALRQQITGDMQKISNAVDKAIEEMPKRRIRMAP